MNSLAEEVSDFYERQKSQIEEELRRSQEENERKQRLLDQILSPRVRLQRLGPGLSQVLQQDVPQIKEECVERSIKQEEEELSE